ncbi:MAG: fibronectin type III domain-containing protein, partial [Planctomycetia bacterium]|nr:fibronectin type III domain-containing protein [Planctomycetia bacterium]
MNTVGTGEPSSVVSGTTPEAPPAKPSGVKATTLSATEIRITWTGVASSSTEYTVERATATGGPWTEVATVTDSTYTDTGLMASTRYYYRVTASNGGGSAVSTSVNATTQAAPPLAPVGVVASVSGTQITLTWNAISNARSYIVERSLNGTGGWTQIGTSTKASYTDSGLGGLTTYYYRISAVNTVGTGESSSVVSGTTPEAPPAAPEGVTVTPVSGSEMEITWDAVSGATTYMVERSANGRSGWIAVAGRTTELSVTDSGLSGGTKYYYRVTASNRVGSGVSSTVVQGTTLPGIVFKAKAIKENTRTGTSAGTFTLSNRAKATYILSDDADGLFTVDSRGNLITTRVPDYEDFSDTGGFVTLQVQAITADGNPIDPIEVSIQIQNVDEAPENLTLTGDTVEEFVPVGTVIGTFSATDPEGDAVSYVLSKSNPYVAIQGNQLVVAKQFLYSQVSQLEISVQAQSGRLKSAARTFTIQVTPKDYSNLTDPITVNLPANKVSISQSNGQVLVMNGRNVVFSAKAQGFPGLVIVGTTKADTVTWELDGWTTDLPITFRGNGGGKDTLIVNGTGGNDTISLTSGGVRYGGTLMSLSGVDLLTVQGNAGDDTYRFEELPDGVSMTISDKSGYDTIDFSAASSGVTFDMGSTKAQSVMGGTLTLRSAATEVLVGSGFSDNLRGTSSGMVIYGGGGSDTLTAVGGKNVLIGGDGSDTLTSTSGENLLTGGRLSDQAAKDQIFAALYQEWILTRNKYDVRVSALESRMSGWFEDDESV